MNKPVLMKVVSILFGAVLVAYGWIFGSVISRIEKVEGKVDSLNTPLLQIQTDLAGIKKDIEWIKNNNR